MHLKAEEFNVFDSLKIKFSDFQLTSACPSDVKQVEQMER